MNSLKAISISILLTLGLYSNAQIESSQSEFEQITKTLMNYIDGTANGEPEN